MFVGAVCQWHTFSTDRSGAETLRELLCSGAIRRHQLGAKDLLTPTSYDSVIETHGRYAVFPTLQNRLHF